MGIIKTLKDEHRELKKKLDEALETHDLDERKELWEEIKLSFLTHAIAEEKEFYDAIRAKLDGEDTMNSEEEDDEDEDSSARASASEEEDEDDEEESEESSEAMDAESDKVRLLEAFKEHSIAEQTLTEIASSELNDEESLATLKVFQDLIEHHIEEEEDSLFELARKVFKKKELDEIEEKFLAAKEAISEEELEAFTSGNIEDDSQENEEEERASSKKAGRGQSGRSKVA
jgi:hypothetical protein